MPEPTKAQLAARVKALEKALKRETAARQRAEQQLAESDRARAEALEQQAATSEILRVISSSPTDVQPVFDTIADSVMRLCSAWSATVYRFDGELIHVTATRGGLPDSANYIRGRFPMRPTLDAPSLVARAIVERTIVHVPDSELDERPGFRETGRARGSRAAIAVPMLRGGAPIGGIGVSRVEPGAFSPAQIEMLKTFADQAVIAIANVRLFTELQASNRELTTALDKQTATSDILRVISRSQTEVQPVFDAIVTSAIRLLGGYTSALIRIAGDQLALAALTSTDPAGDAALRARYPLPLHSEEVIAHVIRDRASLDIADAQDDPRLTEAHKASLRVRGAQCLVAVPLLRHDEALGAIAVTRREPGGFTHDEIALLQTFADQAVIAIENARLLSELQTANRELTTALDQQTATGEILRVISRSPTDAQPVFEAIADSALRLFRGWTATVFRLDGGVLHPLAARGGLPGSGEAPAYRTPQAATRDSVSGRCIVDGTVVHVPDALADADAPSLTRELARTRGFRAALGVPLLRDGTPIGTLAVSRAEPGPFSEAEIALLRTFADQAVIAIENVRLFTELQTSNRELTTALDTQTATSDILRVISRSQTDLQPVFDTILASATRLLGAYAGLLTRRAGEQIEIAALTSTDEAGDAALRAAFPHSRHSEGGHAQVIRDRAALNVADAWIDPRVPEAVRAAARARGNQSLVIVPLLRHDEGVGAIGVTRRDPGGFTDDEIALLETFADQAVIAVENARLLTDLQEKNAALTTAHAETTEALEQQTATSEILRVISSSPTDAQPVFDTIVRSSDRLLGGLAGSLALRVGDEVHLVALTPTNPEGDAHLRRFYPVPIGESGTHGEVVRLGRPVMTTDTEAELTGRTRELARIRGFRSRLSVPLIRDGIAIGSLGVTRAAAGAFTDREIALLKTFADQAVIAIENVRLFTELQTSNRELTTALDTQTATSDILRVISRSQTDVQPVFDAIVQSAQRLLHTHSAALRRLVGEDLIAAAYTTTTFEGEHLAPPPASFSIHSFPGTAARQRAASVVADMLTDPRMPEEGRDTARRRGYRSMLSIPLLREHHVLGLINVTRRDPGGFTDDEIALLQTFADQAVIAIENVRLFQELQQRTQDLSRSVGQLTALSDVSRALSSTLDLQAVLTTIVSRAVQLSDGSGGVVYEHEPATQRWELRATHNIDAEVMDLQRSEPIRLGEGAVGRAVAERSPVQIGDLRETSSSAARARVRDLLIARGYLSVLAVPLLVEDDILGALVILRREAGELAPQTVELMKTFATQSALAIQNARLFRELEIKGRELEVASQHKSEFLASMSHELRTPLNAIIGFSDVLLQGMFGDTNEKQTEYLRDILASGQHLLSLINDILDLTKIEAGRMDLDLADFHLPSAVDDALLLMRERAARRGIALERQVDERLGEIRADQRKVKQVLLNLLSNAVKFTPEGGRIDVRAALANGTVEISVTDTGIGIAPNEHEAVFEEFRQVGKAEKKAEGTGLGLALCRRFVELHGGRIWVKSQLGAGSTFTFSLLMTQ
jgi:GAF domain-containing protein